MWVDQNALKRWLVARILGVIVAAAVGVIVVAIVVVIVRARSRLITLRGD